MMWELADNINPFEKAWSLRKQMERLLDGLDAGREPYPAVNAWSDHDEVVITAEIPGTPRDKVEISVTGDILSLEGAKEEERPGEGAVFHRQERGHGAFSRKLRLPFEVENAKVKATCANGVLRIVLPRAEKTKPQKIMISCE